MQSHPEVIEAAKAALDKYGNGLSSVRFICGTQVVMGRIYGREGGREIEGRRAEKGEWMGKPKEGEWEGG